MSSKLRGPRTLRAAISVVASLMLVLGLAGGVAAADDGSGTMTVNPTTAAGGVGGQTFTFDFTNVHIDDFATNSEVVLTIPAGWTKPQNANAANPGYVTVVEGSYSGTNTCDPGTVVFGGPGPGPWSITIPQTCGHDDHLTITYGNVKPPVTAGQPQAYPFTTQTRDGSGTLTSIQTSPIITVDTLAITFYKEVCPRYSDVPANRSPESSDATGGHWADLNTGYQTAEASPADRPAACAASKGWSFQLREGNNGTLIQTVTTGDDGSYTVYLGSADIAWARGGGVWVNEVLSPAVAGFGALRCYRDVLNGDNLDYVGGVPTGTNQAYCLSYNVRQIITFDPLGNQIYGAGPITLGATATSNLPVSYDASGSCTLGGNSLTLTGVGSCTVTAHQVGLASPFWSAADDVSRTFTIGKADLSVTGPTTNQPYGTATSTFTPIYGPFVAGDGPSTLGTQPTCTSGTTAASPAGVYDITCGGGVSDKYNFIYTAGKLTIGKATLTVKADDQNRAYGAANPTPLTFTYSGWVGGDGTSSISTPPTCSTAADASSAAGTIWPITCSGGTSTNYDLHFVDGALTIGKAGQTITFVKPADRAYGDAPFDLGGWASSGLTVSYGVDSGPCSVLGSTLTMTGVGDCSITASQGGNGNYSAAADVSRTFAIGQATATCTVTPYSVTFDGSAHTATGFCTGIGDMALSGLVLTGTTHTNAADYATDAWTFSNADYASQNGTVHDVITALPTLTITADNKTRVLGAADPVFTYVVSPSVSLTTPATCTTTADASSAVGTYPITCTGAALAGYNVGYVAGTLTVTGTDIVEGATATPTVAPTATPIEQVGGVVATPVRAVTPPPTSSNDNSSNSGSLPLMLILIALAFGGLGLLAVQAQRRTIRR